MSITACWKNRRVSLAIVTAVAAFGALTAVRWSDAQPAAPVVVAPRTAVEARIVTLSEAIGQQLAIEQQQLNARLARLKQHKDALAAAGADQAQIDAVTQIMTAETRDHAARAKVLETWRTTAHPTGRPRGVAERDAVTDEMNDLGRAIGGINQSYVIPPLSADGAVVGGSSYVDQIDPDGRADGVVVADPPRITAEGEFAVPPAEAPPAWMYGEVSAQEILSRNAAQIAELQRTVRELRAELARQHGAVPVTPPPGATPTVVNPPPAARAPQPNAPVPGTVRRPGTFDVQP